MITVVEYDPEWPRRFDALREEYAAALDAAEVPYHGIEHVGSTSVPGLAAKPIIDCDIIVDRQHVAPASEVLVRLGFRPLGELGIPDRWAFAEPARLAGTATYVIVAGSLALRNHLAVRDALRANPVLRDEYAQVKRAQGLRSRDLAEYGKGKNDTIQRILAAAGLSAEERDSINRNVVPPPEVAPR